MAATPSVRVIKHMNFKGGSRLWSNRYHFNGGTPADDTHWHTLMDAIVLQEKTIYEAYITIVECVGYAAGSDVPVSSKTYSTAGTYSAGANDRNTPGEVASLIRYATAARSIKNHPIYCFNYYHNALYDNSAGNVDKISSGLSSAMATYAGHWISGFSDGSITAVRATPTGHAATGSQVEEYLTHRDFPYTSSV